LCGKVVGWIYNKMVDFRTREILKGSARISAASKAFFL